MSWMNQYDVEDAAQRFESSDTPNLMRATQILLALMHWTNRHSDGWFSWAKPGRAADRLEALIQAKRESFRHGATFDHDTQEWVNPTDATEAEVRKALVPIKSFLTRYKEQTRSTDAEIEAILTAGIPKPPTIEEHVRKICHGAGLGVMVGIYEVVLDREGEGVEDSIRGLDADDVEAHYNLYVGRAVDKIEDEMLGSPA